MLTTTTISKIPVVIAAAIAIVIVPPMDVSMAIHCISMTFPKTAHITVDPILLSDAWVKIIRVMKYRGCIDPVIFDSFVSTYRVKNLKYMLDQMMKPYNQLLLIDVP